MLSELTGSTIITPVNCIGLDPSCVFHTSMVQETSNDILNDNVNVYLNISLIQTILEVLTTENQ